MSIDISLVMDTGGDYPAIVEDVGNHTSNTCDMWFKALENPISSLDGRSCREAYPEIDAAVRHMEANPALYRAMNPPNGWGSYETALQYLRNLRDACKRHPKASIQVL